MKKLDLTTFRARISETPQRETWRSLDELAQDPDLGEFLHREFPRQASALDRVDRRDFLKLMSASIAAAGLTACNRPEHHIVPYVRAPENLIPGRPVYYATAMTLGGAAAGLLVESHEGRPTKIEGNPEHPGSLGATDRFAQAEILNLYDPDRSQTVLQAGEVATWSDFLNALIIEMQRLKPVGGRGLHLLTGSVTSPTLGAQIKELLTKLPEARWYQYEPAGENNTREGLRRSFGSYVNPIYHFDAADVVLSLDADFVGSGKGHVRYARDFMDRKRVNTGKKTTNRLYVLESMPTPTGMVSDHRFPMKPSAIRAAAEELAAAVKAGPTAGRTFSEAGTIAADLMQHNGRSLVIAGEGQPPEVHVLAHAMNRVLGNVGRTVSYTAPLEAQPVDELESLRSLVNAMSAGLVDTLVMIGGNPVFNAPADLHFADALKQVRFRAHMSPYYDETSIRCDWHIPQTHFLEEWSDARAYDGTASIVQPLIAPLYSGRSPHELLAALTENGASSYDLVRNQWRSASAASDFESWWRKALHDGVIANTALPVVTTLPSVVGGIGLPTASQPTPSGGALEIVFRHDPTLYDGRYANNGWLQELPKPITKITWDNVAHVAPATAARLNLANEQVVILKRRGGGVRVPVWIVPGHAEDCVSVHFGYGREQIGRVGNDVGANLYIIRTLDSPWSGDVELERTDERITVACTQLHHGMEGRDPVRELTIAQYLQDPEIIRKEAPAIKGESLYPPYEYKGYAWGMTIDTNVCIGCGVCTIACQAENNIPIVGKKEAAYGREMHWIRVDHYYKGSPENPSQFSQPVPCMHCENAPCEPVCPVEATSHSAEGLNDMTYNRCVGTRYCANNCPYKVRRFNFFSYSDYETTSLKLMRNPDVTVRSRGVMEKCTYCVQRINAARIDSDREGRSLRDGEVVPACAQACPTRAIVFGNINDPNAEVTRLKKEPTNYGLLAELNTQPRTTYMATFRNPNPRIR